MVKFPRKGMLTELAIVDDLGQISRLNLFYYELFDLDKERIFFVLVNASHLRVI